MSLTGEHAFELRHPGQFFIGGQWVTPSTSSVFDVINPATEELVIKVAEAQAEDIHRAVTAARTAFDAGPWPQDLRHQHRAVGLLVVFEDRH